MNDLDWTAINAANEARSLMADKVRNGWTPQTAGADHRNCDHAYDYCTNTLNNLYVQEVTK